MAQHQATFKAVFHVALLGMPKNDFEDNVDLKETVDILTRVRVVDAGLKRQIEMNYLSFCE